MIDQPQGTESRQRRADTFGASVGPMVAVMRQAGRSLRQIGVGGREDSQWRPMVSRCGPPRCCNASDNASAASPIAPLTPRDNTGEKIPVVTPPGDNSRSQRHVPLRLWRRAQQLRRTPAGGDDACRICHTGAAAPA
jgi:hypothetical protein